MPTYGSLTQSGYRPHLDSQDFRKVIRYSVVLALGLGGLFSVRGNWLGLGQVLDNSPGWLLLISLAVTLTSGILSAMTIMEIEGVSRAGRLGLFLAALALLGTSISLSYIGFSAGEEKAHIERVQTHPDVITARAELAALLERLNAYGIADAERNSLLAREREQRAYIRELESRVRHEVSTHETSVKAALGDKLKVVRLMFAVTPDIIVAVFSALLTLLFGASISGNAAESANWTPPHTQTMRLQYQPVPTDRRGVSEAPITNQPAEHTVNGQARPAETVTSKSNQSIPSNRPSNEVTW